MSLIVRAGYGNILGAVADWPSRLPAQVALVKAMNVDIFVMVESHGHEAFRAALGAGWAALEGAGNNDVLYRTALYTAPSGNEQIRVNNRSFTRWRMRDNATGLYFYVVAVHLTASAAEPKTGAADRVAQAKALVKWLAPLKEPVILAGDFNSATYSAGYPRSILATGDFLGLRSRADAVNANVNSLNGKLDGKWIDDIYTRSTTYVSEAALFKTNGASDHAGWIRATLDLQRTLPPVEIPEPVIDKPASTKVLDLREAPPGWVPLTIEVWTKDYERRGVVAAPTAVSGMIAHNGPGTFEFTVDADHARVPDLTTDGARAVIRYRYAPGAETRTLISGPVSDVTGAGAASSATRTFRVKDDWTVLNEILGFPNPTGTLAQQGDDAAYFTKSGPAEDVLKAIVEPNAKRQGVALVVPTSAGRGAKCEVSVRMHPLADRLFPAIGDAGLGVRVVQEGDKRYLIVTTASTLPRTLTEASGVVVGGDFSLTAPTVTRVVVGAGGEGKERLFREYVDEELEEAWGFSRSTFVDARDASSDWEAAKENLPDLKADRDQAAKDLKAAQKRYDDLDSARDAAKNAVDKAQDDVDDHPGVSKYATRLTSAKAALTKAEARLADGKKDLDEAKTEATKTADAYAKGPQTIVDAEAAMEADLRARGDEALAQGCPKVSLKVELAETKTFRYGRTFDLGDRVTVRLAGSPDLTDIVRQVSFAYTAEDGLVITPSVGAWEESSSVALYRSVATLARAVRDVTRR